MNFSINVQILNLCFLSHPTSPLSLFFLSSPITPTLTLRILNQVRHSSFSQLHRTLKKACILNKRCCMCIFFSLWHIHTLAHSSDGNEPLWICMKSLSFLYWRSLSLLLSVSISPFLFFCHCRSPSLTFHTGSLRSWYESTSWVILTKNIRWEDESLYDIVQKSEDR